MYKNFVQNVSKEPSSDTATTRVNSNIFCANYQRHSVLPIARRSTSPRSLYEEYVKSKQTLSEIAEQHDLSVSTAQRRVRQVHSTRIVSKFKEMGILMDTTYWGKNFGVLLIVDAYHKRLLWRKFLDKKETIANYLEGIEWLSGHKFKILDIVCDGLWGLPQVLARYKVQYYQFHQIKSR